VHTVRLSLVLLLFNRERVLSTSSVLWYEVMQLYTLHNNYFSLYSIVLVLQSLQIGLDWATPNRLSLCFHSECNSSHQKAWPHCSPCFKNNPVPLGFTQLVKTHFPVRFASALIINCWPNTSMKYHERRNKAIKILNTKIPTKWLFFPWVFPTPDKSLKIPTVGVFPYEWQHWTWSEPLKIRCHVIVTQ